MSLILCPECGSKISDRAISCPQCGYISQDSTLPISVQESYEIVPTFSYDVEEWNPNSGQLNIVSIEDNKSLVQYFGDWSRIQATMPEIAKVIQKYAVKEKFLVAKMDDYVKRLIANGTYRFSVDQQGNILPSIRDSKHIVKFVRLEEMSFPSDISNSLSNIATQAAMAKILNEIEYVGDAIRGLHIELQNDRLALSESSFDKLKLASKIQDTKLREYAVLDALGAATEAKRILMRNFAENLQYITDNSQKGELQLLVEGKKGRDIPQKATEAFQTLVAITNSVRAECQGYAMLGEYDSSKESLLQFKKFIIDNKLDERDTLLLLNENTPQKKIPIVNEFLQIAEKITLFDLNMSLDEKKIVLLPEDVKNE